MRAWANPRVPTLSSRGELPRVYDTGSDVLVTVGERGRAARLYVCGITPYDATHLGHAHTYLAFDLLQRVWLDAGIAVDYAQNITDVDDPLLERAAATGVDWTELAHGQVDLFRTDMEALRIMAPQHYLGVVESMPVIVKAIEVLRDRGVAYQLDDAEYPDWYYPYQGADRVSHLPIGQALPLFAERGGDPARSGKRDPMDCLLWRLARPGEPSWDSSLGRGRPGWHVECTALAQSVLGATVDVQGGGSDLVFPHHEMCAAQGQTLTEVPFARAYVHAGMVGYEGEKMSKSLGNLVLVSQLRQRGVDPMAIRLVLLAHHYRSDWEYTEDDLRMAMERAGRWQRAFARTVAAPSETTIAAIRTALSHDLDAPAALVAVDSWAQQDGSNLGAAAEVALAVDALLGVLW